MSTPYSVIFDRAVFRFRDVDFLKLSNSEIHVVLTNFLKSAIADFAPVCEIDLTDYDDKLAQFNTDLDLECQEILSLGISFYWVSSRVMSQELLRNSLSTKDYTYFSPANLLRESQELRDSLRKEYRDRITQYTYRHGDIASINANT